VKYFNLIRFKQDSATFGSLFFLDTPIVATFEEPWINNQPQLSCIPKGPYIAQLVDSPKHGRVYELQYVPGRSEIQLHVGNDLADTLGCVLVGKYHGLVWKGSPWARKATIGVLDSRIGFKEFMRAAGGDKIITIDITGSDVIK